jgi:hypothetical protein
LLVVVAATWLLARRRPISVIYNIQDTDAEQLIPATLGQMGLAWATRGSAYWIETPRPDGLRRAVLDVAIVPAMRNVTLRWLAAPGDIRWQIERDIRRQLSQIDSPRNPLTGWLLSASVALFGLLFALLGWFLALVWRLRS